MHDSVLKFWFDELEPKQWWQKDQELDALIKNRFGKLHQQACIGELFYWREHAKGALAEVLILDQFSRNIYRNRHESFQFDSLALVLAQSAIEKQFDKVLSEQECVFLYMPFMHSESLMIHEQAVNLYTKLGIATNLEYELKHKQIIERFGRYPHRNKILGRQSTQEEIDFLKQPGSSF